MSSAASGSGCPPAATQATPPPTPDFVAEVVSAQPSEAEVHLGAPKKVCSSCKSDVGDRPIHLFKAKCSAKSSVDTWRCRLCRNLKSRLAQVLKADEHLDADFKATGAEARIAFHKKESKETSQMTGFGGTGEWIDEQDIQEK
ncbi:unnamed protein product [Prorocentrum cordatum]|uniref:Stc1 domain-containing protein n=1 Tax=Prorocentrum cordatum TaxID=2364126 RepID=A0ABN9TAD5_9DINO|nr:unnamed protein product [Polarella glacialis]